MNSRSDFRGKIAESTVLDHEADTIVATYAVTDLIACVSRVVNRDTLDTNVSVDSFYVVFQPICERTLTQPELSFLNIDIDLWVTRETCV